jgi:PKD repeat protein
MLTPFTFKGLFWALLLLPFAVLAQNQNDYRPIISAFLEENRSRLGLSTEDLSDWAITDAYRTDKIQHVYIRQQYRGIPIHNAVANFTLDDQGKVMAMGDRLQRNLSKRISGQAAQLNPLQTLERVLEQLGLEAKEPLRVLEAESPQAFTLSTGGLTNAPIPCRLMYQVGEDEGIYLCWDFSLDLKKGSDWWSLRADARTGKILEKINWTSQCNFHNNPFGRCQHLHHPQQSKRLPPVPASYHVFPLPVESPNHGQRAIIANPSDNLASPHGWHDTNNSTGAEFTITRGNNVYAYEDTSDTDQPGYSPNGGAGLVFDFPLNLNQAPRTNLDAAITNLFYLNNMMHDVWYRYGFTEQAGNFQQNNYGRGGAANDHVLAEAQDGGGTNNANFATPADGSRPRMQMFLWTGSSAGRMEVNAPAGIAGSYGAIESGFGPRITTAITGDVIIALDGVAPNNDGCTALSNAASISGKIALIDRGTCNFVTKVQTAQAAGARAVIVTNNQAGSPFSMGGMATGITIPSVMISQTDGNLLRAQLAAGQTLNVTLFGGNSVGRDGDFDNGVIAHEYGHGISNRLTGGPSNANCLSNAEQMGEGWSDWVGLVMTIRPGDVATTVRGYGTYADGQPINGTGIRPAPYTTDFTVNNFTYAATNNTTAISQPHGIGFVWASMLWDLTWAFIDRYGYDPDLFAGTGGNNIAMRLVLDGMKLQPCNPGFVDGRDAILLADRLNNGGANQCMIWEVFARRGLGASASQGSASSRSDQVEAFDLPTTCQTPTAAPNANFGLSSTTTCTGWVILSDSSSSTPQQWQWDLGDGSSSNQRNVTHRYSSPGTYTIRLIVSNSIGSDTISRLVNYQVPSSPSLNPSNAVVCVGDSLLLTANGSGTIRWYDANGQLLSTGSSYQTPAITANTSFEAENASVFPSQFVGPATSNFGQGGQHTGAFTGTVNFTAYQPLDIVSVWVNSGADSARTIYLWDSINGQGNIVAQVRVNIPAGQGRIPVNIRVPAPGNYSLGAVAANLYRNNAGATFPYRINGLVELNGSSAGTDFYYYFYNWEVQPASCASSRNTVSLSTVQTSYTYTVTGNSVQFTNTSSAGSPAQWTFGDGNSSSDANPSHSFAAPGNYTVRLTIGACSYEQNISIGTTSLEQVQGLSAMIFPQPQALGQTAQLQFSSPLSMDTELEILSVDGRILQRSTVPAGIQSLSLPSNLAAGTYFLRWKNSGAQQTLRWIVAQP